MGQNNISEDLDTFIDKLLEPSEAFARIFMNAYVDIVFSNGKEHDIKANFDDVAQVSGALTTLTRLRLQQLSSVLQQQIGDVEVLQPRRDMVIDYEINGVDVKKKEPPASPQSHTEFEKYPETENDDTEFKKEQ